MQKSTKDLKGTEIVPGKKIYFELQGPNGESKRSESVAADKNGKDSFFGIDILLKAHIVWARTGSNRRCKAYLS